MQDLVFILRDMPHHKAEMLPHYFSILLKIPWAKHCIERRVDFGLTVLRASPHHGEAVEQAEHGWLEQEHWAHILNQQHQAGGSLGKARAFKPKSHRQWHTSSFRDTPKPSQTVSPIGDWICRCLGVYEGGISFKPSHQEWKDGKSCSKWLRTRK